LSELDICGPQIVVNWVFFQVSIAVLLDNFLAASNEMKTEERHKAIQQNQSQKHVKNPLDPLLLKLAKEYTNEDGLSSILRDLFKVWLKSSNPMKDVFMMILFRCWTATIQVV
jgi:hypothetical protein